MELVIIWDSLQTFFKNCFGFKFRIIENQVTYQNRLQLAKGQRGVLKFEPLEKSATKKLQHKKENQWGLWADEALVPWNIGS